MASIKMYNVEFGESILVSNQEEGLLIDCGTDSHTQSNRFRNVIKDLKTKDHKSLMISHFHEDHTNGLIVLLQAFSKQFHEIYLPHIFYTENRMCDFILLREYLQAKSVRFGTRSNLWSLLRNLLSNNARITLLARTNTFNRVALDWEVYWPELVSEDTNQDAFDSIKNNLLLYAERFDNTEIRGQIHRVFERITNLGERIRSLINDFILPDGNNYSSFAERIIAIDQLQVELLELPLDEGLLNSKEVENIISSIKGKENACSIVCEATSQDQQRMLFTGDITKKILKSITSELIHIGHNSFYCIKAPHHGTDSHYVDLSRLYPQNVIISNGQTPFPQGREISKKYMRVGIANIYCTNGSFNIPSRRCAIIRCPFGHKCKKGDISL